VRSVAQCSAAQRSAAHTTHSPAPPAHELTARRAEEINFVPLNEARSFNAEELFTYYRTEKAPRRHALRAG
jgi:hypothetical protein